MLDACLLTRTCTHMQGALNRIKANYGSAYTQPFNLVLLPLQPSTVEQSLIDFAHDSCALVDQAAQTLNIDVSMLTLRQIGNALFGRPAIQNGGPTHFDVLPVLSNTDTKSYEDWHRTCCHLNAHCESSVKVKLVHN